VSSCATVGYIPFGPTGTSAEAGWLAEHLSLDVRLAGEAPSLNDGLARTPSYEDVEAVVEDLLGHSAVLAEGPGGLIWASVLRAHGYGGAVTVLPYLNPRRWDDVAAIAVYRRFARDGDRVFVGSTPSAAIYRSLGIPATVGEPYGIDDRSFRLRAGTASTRLRLGIPRGRMLIYAGRLQRDKDLYRLLRACIKARLLFDDLQVVIATHVEDQQYAERARGGLEGDGHFHFVSDLTPDHLADLYAEADVFATASTSHFETFGRAPAEALACGTPAIAPRYDGFIEVLDQPGGTLVDVVADHAGAPCADEEHLLRAIYDVLSARGSATRSEVSLAARRRFARTVTINRLGYLRAATPALPSPAASAAVPATAAPALPAAWRRALGELVALPPAQALDRLWQRGDHERLAAHDAEFVDGVRRSLCATPGQADVDLRACL